MGQLKAIVWGKKTWYNRVEMCAVNEKRLVAYACSNFKTFFAKSLLHIFGSAAFLARFNL